MVSSSSNLQPNQATESVSTLSLLSVLALYTHVSNSSLFTLSSQAILLVYALRWPPALPKAQSSSFLLDLFLAPAPSPLYLQPPV